MNDCKTEELAETLIDFIMTESGWVGVPLISARRHFITHAKENQMNCSDSTIHGFIQDAITISSLYVTYNPRVRGLQIP